MDKGVYSRIFAQLLRIVFRWDGADTLEKMGLLAIILERIRGEFSHSKFRHTFTELETGGGWRVGRWG